MTDSRTGERITGMSTGAGTFRGRYVNPFVRAVLSSRFHRLMSGSVLVLDYTGRRSGLRRWLPAMYARQGEDLVVVAGQPRTKGWWRNFDARPQRVAVLVQGRRLAGDAALLTDGTDAHAAALAVYRARYPKIVVPADVPVLSVTGLAPAERS